MQKLPAFSLAMILAFQCARGEDLHAMQACTQLGDDTERLSCYDAAMGVAKSVKPGGSARVHSASQFGPKSVSAQVREVTLLPAGLYRLSLDNGQIWETNQADSALVFKAKDTIVISRGLLGGNQVALSGHTTSVGATRKQ